MTGKVDALKLFPLRLGITRLSVGWRFTLCALVMIIYMIVSRNIYDTREYTYADIELLRTPFRLVAALLYWLLMADIIFKRDVHTKLLKRAPLVAGIFIMFAAPILTDAYVVPLPEATIVALTSIPVGLSEELFYRGIIQTLFVRHMGAVQGILAGTLLFTLFHIGVIESGYFNVFLAGLILGLIYWKTGSLLAVVCIHTGYNMLLAAPINSILPDIVAPGLLLITTSLVFSWSKGAT